MTSMCMKGRVALLATVLLSGVSVQAGEFEANSGLKQIGVDKALEAGLTGKGVRIGVLDTGVEAAHPELGGRFLGGLDFTMDQDILADTDGHGTHVAGTIAAAIDGNGMQGVAPDASIFSYRLIGPLLPDAGDVFSRTVASAVENDIHILNASLSVPTLDLLSEAQLQTLTPEFRSRFGGVVGNDMIFVFATGNDGKDQASVLARLPQFVPELESSWLAVTSVGPSGSIATYANKCGAAAWWCLAAPGGDQIASGLHEDGIYSTVPGGGYDYYQGTSMAAPHVSGALALGKEAFAGASYQDLATLLLQTSTDIGDKGVDGVYGWGMLNVGNVVAASRGNHLGIHALSGWGSGVALDGVIDAVSARGGNRMVANRWEDEMANRYPMQRDALAAPTSVWASPFVTHAAIAAGGNAAAAQVMATGLVAGVDLVSQPAGSAGVLAGFSQGQLEASGDKAASSGYFAGVYANLDTDFVVGDFQAGYGTVNTTTERSNVPGLAGTVLQSAVQSGSGREEALWVAGRIGGQLGAGVVELTPYVHGGVTNQRLHASKEGNATILAANLGGTEFYDPTAGVGVKLAGTGMVAGGFVLTPSLDVAYVRHFGDTTHSRSGDVLGNAASASTASLGSDQVDLAAAISFASRSGPLEMNLGYSGSFRENATTHSAKASLAIRF